MKDFQYRSIHPCALTSPSNASLAVLWREIHAMAFHQQIALLIDLYVRIPPLSHISLESLHVLSGHLSAGPCNEGRIGCGR